ncbi:CIC11C00000004817 [Sungouiella intermedia]|uniref:CIC11C00000004817 n=1 Tax=Sungouiella intermedia TaxID=45354 RepID=A0A1L0C6M8_9ASCO|nr:CIC11C00000004817 [[Candida] intermedia]
MSHYNDDDDLFGDEKLRTTSSSSVPRTHSTVVDDEDYFYEKLGGSLYGGLSSAMLPPGGLNVRFADVPLSSFQEYPENDYDIEYPPTAYNRYSKISDMDHEGSQMGVLIMGGPSIMGGRLDGSALMGPPVDGE